MATAKERKLPTGPFNTNWIFGDETIKTARIEVHREGEEDVILRNAPPPEAQPVEHGDRKKQEWKINALAGYKGGIKVRATDGVSGKQVEFGLEAYYDTYIINRGEVQAVSKLLLKTFASKGLEVVVEESAPRPDLMEEMYQLLSIVMSDDAGSKYGSQWDTIRLMYDSQL